MDADELHGYYLEDLKPGMCASNARTVTEADIVLFAGVSGDTNPVHINQEFAAESPFAGRIAHGMLIASYVSTVLGMQLPGPGCIYISQQLRFKAPVRVGDTVKTRVEVREVMSDRKRVILNTVCSVGGQVVLEGEAVMLVTSRLAGGAAT